MTAESEEKSLRYRRAQSVTRAEEITEKEKKARQLQLDKPCHVPRDSLFSWSSQFTDFTGLVNLGFLMLSIGGLRLCLENFLKYGIRFNPIEWIVMLTGGNAGAAYYPSLILLLFSPVPAVCSLLVEKGIALGRVGERCGWWLHVCALVTAIALPVLVLHRHGDQFSFVGAELACMVYLVVFLKMWSYVQVNRWCREGRERHRHHTNNTHHAALRRQSLSAPNQNELMNAEQEQLTEEVDAMAAAGGVQYPDNLTLRDLAYFLLAPTLCYELNFPRTTRIRKRFVIKRLLELVFGVNLMICLFQQWMTPSISSSVHTLSHIDLFSQMDYLRLVERLLKLSVPNHLLWLCAFYLSFHSFLNFCGELLHFADRNFYNDWWNARDLNVFWASWNMPVHRWAVRHVYVPITRKGYGKTTASVVVFFISAFFHEYLVSVPLQMFRVWAFLGMMAQPPLAVVTQLIQRRLGDRWGNLCVWASLILGQPLAVMMYYHDYALIHLAKN